jgi:formylglycine-generating enzyme required for sulfatase activity
LAAFSLDPTEVTVGAYRRGGFPLDRRLRDKYSDAEGRLKLPDNYDRYAVTYVTFHQALEFAEAAGKRLPSEAEYEFAATAGGRQRFPWGDDATPITGWPMGVVREARFDQTATDPPVFGLYSNVAEWTDSRPFPYHSDHPPGAFPPEMLRAYRASRVVRGAPPYVLEGRFAVANDLINGPLWLNARWRQADRVDSAGPTVGFRCARSARLRFLD